MVRRYRAISQQTLEIWGGVPGGNASRAEQTLTQSTRQLFVQGYLKPAIYEVSIITAKHRVKALTT